MRTAVDYAQHATECRRLASECTKPEHWEHFLEMAETWEQLGKNQELSNKLKSAGILKTKMPAAVQLIENAVRDLAQRN